MNESTINSNLNTNISISEGNLLEETMTCLLKTFTEKNNEERRKAEHRLKELQGNILAHIQTILEGLGSSDLKQDLKLSIILYLKNSIRSRLDLKTFTNEDVIVIINVFIQAMLKGKLNDQLMQNLNLTFTSVLNSVYVTQNPDIIVNISEFLLNYAKSEEGNDIEIILNFKPVTLLLQTIVSSTSTNLDNITDVITKHIAIAEYMIHRVMEKLKSFTIHDDSVVYVTIVDIVRLILDYLFLSLLKLKKIEMLDNTIAVYINKFIPFTVEAVSICSPSEKSFIVFTGDKQIDNCVNSMKAKCFQLIAFMVQNEGSVMKNNDLIQNLSKIVGVTISSLGVVVSEKMDYLSNMSKNSQNFPDYNYENLLFQIMLFLSRFLAREPIISEFTNFVKNFVLTVIFPLLQTTAIDITEMHTEGEEHHKNSLDYILQHRGKSYKTAASFLLIKLCDKYDGLASFVINLSMEVIDFCMNGSDINIVANYNILNQSKNETLFSSGVQKVLTSLSTESQIDTCLSVLLILSNQLNKNSKFLAMLRIILETHSEKFLIINSEMIKDKLCLIFGTFLDDLYQSDEVQNFYTHLAKIFDFLFQQILSYQKNSGTAYNAAYSLCQLIYHKDFSDVTNNIIRKLLPLIVECIKEIEVVLFFDVIADIIIYTDIEDSIMQICKELVTRILKEVKSVKKPGEKERETNVYINKSFHILRSILEKNKMFVKEEESKSDVEVVLGGDVLEIEEFETIIQPVVMYFKNVNKIEFDDEIIYLMINVLQNARKITYLAKGILTFLPQYLVKNEGMTEDLFELLNLYIFYDRQDYLTTDTEAMQTMMYLIKSGMEENEEIENSPIHSSMLAQAWLQSNANIPDNIVVELINFHLRELEGIYSIYQDNPDQLESTFDLYLYSTFMTTIYSSFVNYPIQTLTKINQLNLLPDFILWTELMTTFGFFSSRQSKVIVLGICAVLSNQTIIMNIDGGFVKKFLLFAFSYLIKQKNAETKKLKTTLKNEIECNFIHSDDEEEDDEDENDGEKSNAYKMKEMKTLSRKIQKMNKNVDFSFKNEKDIIKIIDKLKIPMNGTDEYAVFCQTLANLNSLNNQILVEFVGMLNDPQKEIWNELLHTRRIQVNYSGQVMEVPRRTVKIKRNENN